MISIQTRLRRGDAELLELLERVLKIQEKENPGSEEVMQTLKKIVYYLDKIERKGEKFSMQRRLSVLRMKYKQMVQYYYHNSSACRNWMSHLSVDALLFLHKQVVKF